MEKSHTNILEILPCGKSNLWWEKQRFLFHPWDLCHSWVFWSCSGCLMLVTLPEFPILLRNPAGATEEARNFSAPGFLRDLSSLVLIWAVALQEFLVPKLDPGIYWGGKLVSAGAGSVTGSPRMRAGRAECPRLLTWIRERLILVFSPLFSPRSFSGKVVCRDPNLPGCTEILWNKWNNQICSTPG